MRIAQEDHELGLMAREKSQLRSLMTDEHPPVTLCCWSTPLARVNCSLDPKYQGVLGSGHFTLLRLVFHKMNMLSTMPIHVSMRL